MFGLSKVRIHAIFLHAMLSFVKLTRMTPLYGLEFTAVCYMIHVYILVQTYS